MTLLLGLLLVLLLPAFALSLAADGETKNVARADRTVNVSDVLVYGSTPGGIMAAVAAGRQGLKVALLSQTSHVGGMSSGGLGKSDIGNPSVIGGLAHEFFLRNGKHYGATTPEYDLEPHVALSIFRQMLAEANVTTYESKEIVAVTATGNSAVLSQVQTLDGSTYNASVFIDASYEGDLLALAKVPYTVGRESATAYNETLAGFRGYAKGHEFTAQVDPFLGGANASALLPFITPMPDESVGAGDARVQAYNFRLCITQNASNMVPFSKPPGYNPDDWELARRLFRATKPQVPPGNAGSLPNGKYDLNNNGPVSTDMIGGANQYPEGSRSQRQEIWNAHKQYTQGLLWFFMQDPSLPTEVHSEMKKWGLCQDEFLETSNWPPQLYIREARRMKGDFVFTQSYVENNRKSDIGNRSIGMGSYNYDMHNTQRYACTNASSCNHFAPPYAWNEGDVETSPGYLYQIPVDVLFPPKKTAKNLLVSVAVSASHVGYGTLRMEPQFMIMGHAAGIVASVAIRNSTTGSIQDVDLDTVAELLARTNQIVRNPAPAVPVAREA